MFTEVIVSIRIILRRSQQPQYGFELADIGSIR